MSTVSSPTIKVLRLNPVARLPRYSHTGPWGDLAADVYAVEAVTLPAGKTVMVSTGIALEFPSEYGALIEDRSGLAVKGITTLAGVIDPGYRGEIRIVVTNLNETPYEIAAGDRVAQLRIVQRITADFVETDVIEPAERGERGFGSTGV